MKLYEIDRAIEELTSSFDPETGEALFDEAAFEALALQREQAIEDLALSVKNYTAEAKAIREEAAALSERARRAEKSAESAKRYLAYVLNGEKYSSPRASVSWRRSTSVKPEADFVSWAMDNRDDLLRYKDPEPNLTDIKRALDSGEEIPFVHLETKTSAVIK